MTEIDQELAFLGAPIRATFVPHLLPLDQGELVSCYCTLRTARSTSTRCSRDAYARRAVRRARPTGRPGVRDVRDTNFCRIHARVDERTGKVFVFAAIDNLWKGAVVAGGPEPQPDVRRRRDGRAAVSAVLLARAGSRCPSGVREDAAGGLPAGFRAAGVAAGIKPSGGTDVGLLVCDAPETTSAARFTRSGVLAAPVLVTPRARAPGRAARRGRQLGQRQRRHRRARAWTTRRKMQGAAAMAGGVPSRPGRRRLDRRHRRAARRAARWSAASRAPRAELRPDGDADFTAAIMTTDAFEKRATPRGRRCRAAPCACARRPRARA